MGKTFSEKVFSAKAGREVKAGEIVTLEPDFILTHDNTAAIMKKLPAIGVSRLKHPERAVIVLDHVTPAADSKHAANHKAIREFVAAQGIKHFYDVGFGVCHQVMVEEGLAYPGRLILGSDSHTTTAGAVGAFAAGIGRTETAGVWVISRGGVRGRSDGGAEPPGPDGTVQSRSRDGREERLLPAGCGDRRLPGRAGGQA